MVSLIEAGGLYLVVVGLYKDIQCSNNELIEMPTLYPFTDPHIAEEVYTIMCGVK